MFSLPLPPPPWPSLSSVDKNGVLRGPSWTVKGVLPAPPRPSVSSVDQKKGVLRAPPRPSVSSADKKGVLPDPSWPFADKKKLFSAPLRGPPCPPWIKKKMLSPPLAPLRGQSTHCPYNLRSHKLQRLLICIQPVKFGRRLTHNAGPQMLRKLPHRENRARHRPSGGNRSKTSASDQPETSPASRGSGPCLAAPPTVA